MKNKLIYLATPYSFIVKSKEIGLTKPDYSKQEREVKQKRFEAVNEVAAKLIKKGFVVVSPISHSHSIAEQCDIDASFETWAQLDFALIARCDMVFVYCQKGWEDSQGIKNEINFANKAQLPVMFIDENLTILKAG